jgi:hypothetical protein
VIPEDITVLHCNGAVSISRRGKRNFASSQ